MRAILTFHSVDDSGSYLSCPVKVFADILESLTKNNLPVCDLDALLKPGMDSGVVITFDDGMKSVYANALPLLRDYNATAHIFVSTGVIGKDNRWPSQPARAPYFEMLNWQELEQLHQYGIKIDSHTDSHPDLRQMDIAEITKECMTADDLIQERLGRRPEYFAYPYGHYNTRIKNYVNNTYKASLTTKMGQVTQNSNLAELPRLDSYYLKTPWVYHNISNIIPYAYLRLRGFIHTLRSGD